MDKVINVGLIGYGISGRVFHAPIIDSVTGFKLYKVCVNNEENIKLLKRNFDDVIVVSNTDDIIFDEKVELVVIAVPNTAHYSIAKRALENGKHVIIEKPFTIDTKEADELIEISLKKERMLTVYQNRRWDSDFRTVRKLIDSGVLGTIVEYEAQFDRFRANLKENSWKEIEGPGSGLLYDLGSHLIDQALCLFGNPKEVFADLRMQRENTSIVDNFELILNYDKLKVTLKSGMLVRELGPKFIVTGTKGSFIKYGMDIQEEHLRRGEVPKNDVNWGKEPEIIKGSIYTEFNGINFNGKIESEKGDYRLFYKNIYRNILNGEKLEIMPIQARDTIKIIELCQKSNDERKWMKL
ncbi:MAG: Gfo/Idh/MocA family oxidoreductase [Proteocatella sp.]